jgi:hypothetical protein
MADDSDHDGKAETAGKMKQRHKLELRVRTRALVRIALVTRLVTC